MQKYESGIYNISNEIYHASDGISRSGVMELKKSPLHLWDRYLNPDRPPKKLSKPLTLGSALNHILLEPQLFHLEFAVCKKVNGATKAGKAYKIEFAESAAGRQIITEEEHALLTQIADAIKAHPKSAKVLNGAKIETSIYWRDEVTDLLCKARPDIWNQELNILCDLKTAAEAWPESFSYSVRRYGYHIQAAMQIDGVEKLTGKKVDNFLFIVAPTERPHKPYFYILPEAMISLGRQEYREALKVAKICMDKGRWDMDRDLVIPLDFSVFQMTTNSFSKLTETYHERISA